VLIRSEISRFSARFGSKFCGSHAFTKQQLSVHTMTARNRLVQMKRCSCEVGASPHPPYRSRAAIRADAASIDAILECANSAENRRRVPEALVGFSARLKATDVDCRCTLDEVDGIMAGLSIGLAPLRNGLRQARRILHLRHHSATQFSHLLGLTSDHGKFFSIWRSS
jgi:hypothetical protein